MAHPNPELSVKDILELGGLEVPADPELLAQARKAEKSSFPVKVAGQLAVVGLEPGRIVLVRPPSLDDIVVAKTKVPGAGTNGDFVRVIHSATDHDPRDYGILTKRVADMFIDLAGKPDQRVAVFRSVTPKYDSREHLTVDSPPRIDYQADRAEQLDIAMGAGYDWLVKEMLASELGNIPEDEALGYLSQLTVNNVNQLASRPGIRFVGL